MDSKYDQVEGSSSRKNGVSDVIIYRPWKYLGDHLDDKNGAEEAIIKKFPESTIVP